MSRLPRDLDMNDGDGLDRVPPEDLIPLFNGHDINPDDDHTDLNDLLDAVGTESEDTEELHLGEQ